MKIRELLLNRRIQQPDILYQTAPKNITENKIPLPATCLKKILINNIRRVNKNNKDDTHIFDDNGKEVNVGNISCPFRHDAYQYRSNEKGIKREAGSSLCGKFLRTENYNMVCMDCHGLDALVKYEYFHDPYKCAKTAGK